MNLTFWIKWDPPSLIYEKLIWETKQRLWMVSICTYLISWVHFLQWLCHSFLSPTLECSGKITELGVRRFKFWLWLHLSHNGSDDLSQVWTAEGQGSCFIHFSIPNPSHMLDLKHSLLNWTYHWVFSFV